LFTQSDVQVAQNYCDLFIPKFKNNEIRNMLLSFACIDVENMSNTKRASTCFIVIIMCSFINTKECILIKQY
jgi:hypothetical protein